MSPVLAALTMITDLTDRRREIESEPPPLFAGLSVDGRRAVNLAVIAYAELLHERLAATDLPLFPWHNSPKPRFVRIVPIETTGRHFTATPTNRNQEPA